MPFIPVAVVNEAGTPVVETALEQYIDAVLADTPLAYWKLDDASGLPQDSSGNGNHMTAVSGSPTYQQAGPYGAGSIELAIQYPSAAFHDRPVVSSATTDFTVELWVRRNGATTTNGNLFHQGTTSGGFEIEFSGVGGQIRVNLPGVGVLGSLGMVLADTTWTYIAVRRETTQWSSMMGATTGSNAVAQPGTASPGTPVGNIRILGAAATDTRLAHVAFYGSALSWQNLGKRFLIASGAI